MTRVQIGSLVVALLMIAPLGVVGTGGTVSEIASALHSPVKAAPGVLPGPGSFAFVANFEDGALDGWTAASGSARVVTTPNYNGEPALRSTAKSVGPQIDLAGSSSGVVAGDTFVSFQADVNPGSGTGFVGLADASGFPVAVIGVGGGYVWAGANPAQATVVEPIPTGTAQPAGWVYLSANVYATTLKNKSTAWVMDVFVDRTDVVAASQVSVPNAGGYAAALLETTSGTVYYTNTILANYQIPVQIPGYNNMDGYGQGSGLLVQLLPSFTTLTATMTLSSWDTPQTGILSFQINAMNYYGTTRSSCKGFFQLGVDLDPSGYIAPWYVDGTNCIAHYFGNSNSGAISSGFPSPPGTTLELTIQDQPAANQIFFQIVDTAPGVAAADRYWNATIAYGGTPFYGSYTQVEWQPCCSNYPISDYAFSGALTNLAISGGSVAAPTALEAQYMLPFALDLPPSWNLNYYDSSVAGYQQVT